MVGSASVLRARRDVYTVYQIWQQVHRVGSDVGSNSSLTKRLSELIDGHVAGRCALAQSLPRILTKVNIDFETQLRLVISILSALTEGPDALKETATEAIIPVLQGLVSQPRFRAASDASSKPTFKSLVLNLFQLSYVSQQAHYAILNVASTAFESRPYTFIIALTDALEDESHPALNGAVAFANEAFLGDLRESGLFLRVMKSEPEAAPQVAMLLQSCMKDMHQRGRLPESLHVMSELEMGLRKIDPKLGTPIAAAAATPAAAPRPTPSPVCLGKRDRASAESNELPGPPPRISNAPSASAAPAYTPSQPSKEELPPPPKRRSTPRRSDTGSPQPVERRRTTPFVAHTWRSCPALAKMSLQSLIGDPEQEERRVSLVGPSVCIHGIPHRAHSRDLVRAVSGMPKLVHAEVLPSHCAVLQFSSMAAAVACVKTLGRSLDRLSWRAANFTFAAPAGVVESARGEHWIWVACKASRLALEGILHVLHSGSIDAPTSHHIASDTHAHCASGCLLLCSSAAHAEACVKHLRQWIEDVSQMRQAAAVPDIAPKADVPEERPTSGLTRSASPQPPAPTAEASPRPAAIEAGPLWTGSIAKSTIPQCSVYVSVASSYTARGCQGWPGMLDMQHRIMIPQALELWKEHDPDHRGWAWVQPDGDAQAFEKFVQYLTARDRAGIVRPPVAPEVLFHTLYLIPAPSDDVAEQVGASKEGATQLLLLLQASQAPTG